MESAGDFLGSSAHWINHMGRRHQSGFWIENGSSKCFDCRFLSKNMIKEPPSQPGTVTQLLVISNRSDFKVVRVIELSNCVSIPQASSV